MMTRSMTRIAELEKEIEKLKIHNERLQKQTGDLWELASFCDGDGFVIQYHQIEQLIEMRGEEYVKEVFAEDYEDYKDYKEDDEKEDDEEEDDEKEDDPHARARQRRAAASYSVTTWEDIQKTMRRKTTTSRMSYGEQDE